MFSNSVENHLMKTGCSMIPKQIMLQFLKCKNGPYITLSDELIYLDPVQVTPLYKFGFLMRFKQMKFTSCLTFTDEKFLIRRTIKFSIENYSIKCYRNYNLF